MRAVRRWSCVLLLASALAALSALASCGGGDDRAASPSPVTSGKPDFTDPSPSSVLWGVQPVAVEGDLVVARLESERVAAWRVTPATGEEDLVAELPSLPADALASPDGRRVAFSLETESGSLRGMVGILDVGAGSLDIQDGRGSGLREVVGMTWLSSSRMLVSGPLAKAASSSEAEDVMRVFDLRTDSVEPFTPESGASPSAALDAGEVVFDRLTELDEEQGETVVREELMRADIQSGTETVVLSEDYTRYAAEQRFGWPFASPDARFVVTAGTGSDTGVVWRLWRTDDGVEIWRKQTSMAYPLHAAWDAEGRRVACWGMSTGGRPRTFVWVYDTGTGEVARSPDLGEGVVVSGVDWSRNGDLAVGVWSLGYASTSLPPQVVMVAPQGDLAELKPLCEGAVPVWVD